MNFLNKIIVPISKLIKREYYRILYLTDKYFFGIVSIFLLVLGLLGLRLLILNNIITNDFAKENKDLIELLERVLNLSIFIFAGVASYIRFFKGRTFNLRMNIKLSGKVYPSNETENMFVGDIKLINTGNFAIKGLKIKYVMFNLEDENTIKEVDLNLLKFNYYEELIVESNETEQLQFNEILDKEIKFYKIKFLFRSLNHEWTREHIINNSAIKK